MKANPPPFKTRIIRISGSLYARIPAWWLKAYQKDIEAGDEVEIQFLNL